MFWALLAVAIGTTVKIVGSIIESKEEEKARKLKEAQAAEEAAYLAEAAEFAELKAETMATGFEEEAGLVTKETALVRGEIGRKVSEVGMAGTEQLAFQKAATFAGGFEGGSSYEAVRKRFEQRLMAQTGQTYERGKLAMERGTLSAQRLLTQASLTRGGSEIEQAHYELQIAGLGREIEMLKYQEDIAPWKLGLNIAGDIFSGGMSLATSGVKPPGSSGTTGDIHPMSTGWL